MSARQSRMLSALRPKSKYTTDGRSGCGCTGCVGAGVGAGVGATKGVGATNAGVGGGGGARWMEGSTIGFPRTVLLFTTRFSFRMANGDIAGSVSCSPTSENCSISVEFLPVYAGQVYPYRM